MEENGGNEKNGGNGGNGGENGEYIIWRWVVLVYCSQQHAQCSSFQVFSIHLCVCRGECDEFLHNGPIININKH